MNGKEAVLKLNTREFGELLRALRGAQSQRQVSEGASIAQQTLSGYENGEVDSPSFENIIRLANYYGLTPNIMAALAGLYAEPGTEDEQFPPDVARVLQQVYIQMLDLGTAAKQRRYATLLSAVTKEAANTADQDDNVLTSRLPNYVKKRLTSDGSDTRAIRRHTQRGDVVVEERD